MKNKKLLSVLILVTFISITLAFLPSCKKGEEKADEVKIKIGAILPLTGYLGFVGENFKNGLMLALDGVKEIDIRIGDSKGNAKEGVTILRKFLIDKEIKIVISVLSSVTDAILPFFKNDSSRLLIATITSKSGLPGFSSSVYRYFLSSEDEVKSVVNYLEKNEIKKIGVFYVNDDFGEDAYKIFKRKYDGEILISEEFSTNEKDFRASISKFLNLDITNIYLIGYGQWYVSVVKQLKELNFQGRIFAFSGFGSPVVLNSLKEVAQNVLFSGPLFQPSGGMLTEYAAGFVDAYEKRYGKKPDHYSAYGFDIGILISNLVRDFYKENKSLGTFDIEKFREFVSSRKAFIGVFGETRQDKLGDFHFKVKIFKIDKNLLISECDEE